MLAAVGTYRVTFSAPIDSNAQVQVMLNDVAVPYAAFGRWSYSILSGETFIATSVADSTLTIRNSGPSFDMIPYAAGGQPVAAHLTIEQMS